MTPPGETSAGRITVSQTFVNPQRIDQGTQKKGNPEPSPHRHRRSQTGAFWVDRLIKYRRTEQAKDQVRYQDTKGDSDSLPFSVAFLEELFLVIIQSLRPTPGPLSTWCPRVPLEVRYDQLLAHLSFFYNNKSLQ